MSPGQPVMPEASAEQPLMGGAPLEQPTVEPAEDEQELMSQMIAEAVEYIHGKARDQIVEQLRSAEDTADTMAGITYKLTRGLIDKHREQGMAMDMGMDFAIGLATEVIDMQMEMLERIQPGIANSGQKLREDVLLKTVMLHAEETGGSPEAKEQAQQMLRGMMQDGSVDQAFGYVNQRAAQEGLNVEDMIRRGNTMAQEMVGGGQKPVAAGVQQGLMGGSDV